MPKEQRSMSHHARTEPYPAIISVEPARASTNERSSTAWSHEDDARLMQFRAQGMLWNPIAKRFPSRSGNACRKRHERLMEKKSAESWDGIKFEDLARAYLNCRERMWTILAEAVGEKWQTVEMKCMEKSLKDLQTAGRAARRHIVRHSSLEYSQHSASEFDDSGLGFPHSPSVASSTHPPLPSLQHSQASSVFPHGLAPLPNQQQRTGSISSVSSSAPVPQPTLAHRQPPPHQRFPYGSSHSQSPLYGSSTAPSPSAYLGSSGFGNTTFSPTGTAGYNVAQTLPSISRNFEGMSRPSQLALPPLPPSLLASSRTHQEPITASY